MKKLKVLAIMLATVLCFSVAALVGCSNNDKDPDPKPDNKPTTEVPVVDGKVTFYFTVADGSVDIPEYGAVFYAGGLTDWNETGAPAFTKLEGKAVYYIQLEVDNTKTQWDEYSLTLGYNAESGLPADKQGIQWSLKSDECAVVPFPDNLKFELADGAKTVNLGTHTFSTALSAPETVAKVELRVTFSEPLDPTYEVYFMGGFNSWDSTKAKATANTERTTYSLELKDILCTDYEYKILVMATGENVVTKNDKGEDLGVWDQYFKDPTLMGAPADSKVYARLEVSAGGSNLAMKVIKRDNNSYIDLADTVSVAVPSDNIAVKGLDIRNTTAVEGKNDDGTGNGVFTPILSLAGTKTLKVEFKEALPADVNVYIIGNFLDSGWKTTVGQARMTIAADRMSASVDYEVLPKTYTFNMIFIHKDVELHEDSSDNVQAIWDYGFKASNDNITVEVEGYDDSEVGLLTDKLTVPTVTAPEMATSVTLKVTFDTAVAADKHVVISGGFNEWGATEMTADTERKVFTLTISKIIAKTYEFKVSVSDDTAMNWNNAWGENGEYSGGNASFTVGEANSNKTVELFAAALVTPAN